MRIEAGTLRRRLIENALFTVAAVVFGTWFLYDGMVGYPEKNKAVRQQDAREKEKNPDFIPQKEPKYSDADIAIQKILAGMCGAVAILMAVGVLRAGKTSVVLDDEGLHVNKQPAIPFEAMTALKTDRWKDKGWVDLEYADGGRTRRVRLDSFKIEPCEPIIAAICERKGFASPIPAETDEPPAR